MTDSTSQPVSPAPVLLSLAHASSVQGVVDVEGFWNVATKATDIVKDGNRIENLAWRHWARPHRKPSSSSLRTESSAASGSGSVQTPPEGCRTFGCTLRLLMADDGFKDWVAEAKDNRDHHTHDLHTPHRPPRIHVPPDEAISVKAVPEATTSSAAIEPGSPVSNLEIRLVEPTPVPSRVGSLGTSLNPGYGPGQGHYLMSNGHGNGPQVPPALDEEDEAETTSNPAEAGDISPKKQRAKKGKFFVQASPTKASVSDSSPVAPTAPSLPPSSPQASTSRQPAIPAPSANLNHNRRSSGSSTGASKKKRHVSLSTMRGKFHAEKRRAAAAMEAKEAREEDGGWEDEDEDLDDWSDDEAEQASMTASPEQIPPPAPTPLVRMSKKQREAAAADRARIEAELDAQRKREMFAKQAIFGQPQGLLSQALQRGGSLVDLPTAATTRGSTIASTSTSANTANTHKGHRNSTFSQSPIGPNLLRSKSAVAIPVQTGVSVTVQQGSGGSNRSQTSQQTNGSGGNGSKAKLDPPQPRPRLRPPSAEHLETTDESESDDYLATSSTQHKLNSLLKQKEEAKAAREAAALAPPIQPFPVAISPTTDRRAMIMREMSESLRKNLILERQKSSTNLTTNRQPDQPAPPRPNVLAGGFLRPLTRVGNASTSNLNRTQSTANINRTQSSANLTTSPTSPAPPMTRSNTSGGGLYEHRAELQRRTNDRDTSYRTHGW